MATAKQIAKKLTKAGINLQGLEISDNEIEILAGYTERFNGVRNIGTCDEERVEEVKKQIQKSLPEFSGGYYTGYGSLVLQIGYRSVQGDYNDVCSEHHY